MKVIAETAFHHEGDYAFMCELVEELCKSKADIIKVHLLMDLDSYMTKDHPLHGALSKFLFTEDQWSSLLERIKNSGKELMALVNDVRAANFASQFHPELIELHSVALNDKHLIDAVKKSSEETTKVVLGVGGSRLEEVEHAASFFHPHQVVLMFGFQNYPTKYEDINFKKMRRIMAAFPEYSYGYADHTAWDNEHNELVTLLGAAQGGSYIEKHVTTVYGEKRTDAAAAISIPMLASLIEKKNVLEAALGNGDIALNDAELSYCTPGYMKKTAILSSNVKKGHVLTFDDLVFSRTAKSDLSQLDAWGLVGKQFNEDLAAGVVLRRENLES